MRSEILDITGGRDGKLSAAYCTGNDADEVDGQTIDILRNPPCDASRQHVAWHREPLEIPGGPDARIEWLGGYVATLTSRLEHMRSLRQTREIIAAGITDLADQEATDGP